MAQTLLSFVGMWRDLFFLFFAIFLESGAKAAIPNAPSSGIPSFVTQLRCQTGGRIRDGGLLFKFYNDPSGANACMKLWTAGKSNDRGDFDEESIPLSPRSSFLAKGGFLYINAMSVPHGSMTRFINSALQNVGGLPPSYRGKWRFGDSHGLRQQNAVCCLAGYPVERRLGIDCVHSSLADRARLHIMNEIIASPLNNKGKQKFIHRILTF